MAITKLIADSITSGAIANTPMVSVRMTNNQTLPNSSNTLLAFDNVDIDTDSAYTNTAGNYKFTVPSGKAGTYMITLMTTSFNENSDTLRVQNHIFKNGISISMQRQRHDGGGAHTRMAGTTTHWVGTLAVGDYIQFYYLHQITSGSPLTLSDTQSRATITRLIT